jgi:phage repressor protein C with HTH and peptisase S24 domain
MDGVSEVQKCPGMTDRIAWIREGLKKPGKNQVGLAAALGRAPSAVTSLLQGTRRLMADEIPVIAAYLEVEPPFDPARLPKLQTFEEFEAETLPTLRPGLAPASRNFTLARVDGRVQAGAFLQTEVFDDDLGETISAPRDPDFPFARQIAYRVGGDSMNQAEPRPIRDGDYIICVAFEDVGLKPANGMKVVVQKTINDGQLRERSVKEVRTFPDRTEFHPRSSNPAHKPIVVPHNPDPDDSTTVEILSLVRFIFDNVPVPLPMGELQR